MSLIKGKNTRPERLVPKIVYKLGFRFRLHYSKLPGRPDLAFVKLRKVIFVHGCFWYWHAEPACRRAHIPKSRRDFWLPKLEANRVRDEMIQNQLIHRGWESLVIWECQLNDRPLLEDRIQAFLERGRKT